MKGNAIDTKIVSELISGDVLILGDGTKATVTSLKELGIVQTPSGKALSVHWKTEAGDDGRQAVDPDAEVRVEVSDRELKK